MQRFLRFHGVKSVDGILADFGVSSHQFDQPERGFSIRFDALLDMRMNQQDVLSAHSLVNSYEEEALRQVFWQYGELRTAPALAKTIVQARELAPIDTTFDLKTVLNKHLPQGRENKILAQIYQAIRIEVNQEIEVLKDFLLHDGVDGACSIGSNIPSFILANINRYKVVVEMEENRLKFF